MGSEWGRGGSVRPTASARGFVGTYLYEIISPLGYGNFGSVYNLLNVSDTCSENWIYVNIDDTDKAFFLLSVIRLTFLVLGTKMNFLNYFFVPNLINTFNTRSKNWICF